MSAFTYRARNGNGVLVRGRMEATGSPEAVARLRSQGLLVVSLEPDRDLSSAISRLPVLRRVSARELALFLRQFATMVAAGLPVVGTLRVLARQSQNRVLQKALFQAVRAVEDGETLSGAFAQTGVFPKVMLHMVGAGEVGGMLDTVLERLASQMEREDRLRHKVRSAFVYPLAVTGIAVLVVIFLIIFVVPRFVQFFSDFGGILPLPTRLLIAASELFRQWWWLGVAGAGLGWLGLRQWARSERGGRVVDRLILRLPAFGPMLQKYSIARFCQVLTGLMSSGVAILLALAVAERVVGNRQISGAILGALDSVRKGQGLVQPLAQSGLFPPMVLEMIAIGEESGTLETMLSKVAEFYEDEVMRSAEGLSGALEPFLIFFLAIVVGAVVVAMIAPVFDLWTLIG